jgi:hypothetical protein
MIKVTDEEIRCNCGILPGSYRSYTAKETMALGLFYMAFNDWIYDLHDLPVDLSKMSSDRWNRIAIFSRKDGWHPAYTYLGSAYVQGISLHSVCICKPVAA